MSSQIHIHIYDNQIIETKELFFKHDTQWQYIASFDYAKKNHF